MANSERLRIEIDSIRRSVNAILDHVESDVGVKSIEVDIDNSMYWTIPCDEIFNLEKDPNAQYIGNLNDDYEFVQNMLVYNDAEIRPPVLMLEHVVGLLLAVAHKIRG